MAEMKLGAHTQWRLWAQVQLARRLLVLATATLGDLDQMVRAAAEQLPDAGQVVTCSAKDVPALAALAAAAHGGPASRAEQRPGPGSVPVGPVAVPTEVFVTVADAAAMVSRSSKHIHRGMRHLTRKKVGRRWVVEVGSVVELAKRMDWPVSLDRLAAIRAHARNANCACYVGEDI